MSARVRLNHANLKRILEVESGPHVQRIAERVAASTVAAAGTVDGQQVTVDLHDNDSTSAQRYRVGLVITHPTAKGRKAGNDAAVAAMQVAGE